MAAEPVEAAESAAPAAPGTPGTPGTPERPGTPGTVRPGGRTARVRAAVLRAAEDALVADLLTDMAEQSLPRSRSGSLAEDLRANARLVRRTLADPRQGALFRAVIVAANGDPGTAEALRHFYRRRVEEWAPCVTEAVERGELPPDTDPFEVIRAVSAPLYYRMLTTAEPLDEPAADRAAAAAEAAARAGAYRRQEP